MEPPLQSRLNTDLAPVWLCELPEFQQKGSIKFFPDVAIHPDDTIEASSESSQHCVNALPVPATTERIGETLPASAPMAATWVWNSSNKMELSCIQSEANWGDGSNRPLTTSGSNDHHDVDDQMELAVCSSLSQCNFTERVADEENWAIMPLGGVAAAASAPAGSTAPETRPPFAILVSQDHHYPSGHNSSDSDSLKDMLTRSDAGWQWQPERDLHAARPQPHQDDQQSRVPWCPHAHADSEAGEGRECTTHHCRPAERQPVSKADVMVGLRQTEAAPSWRTEGANPSDDWNESGCEGHQAEAAGGGCDPPEQQACAISGSQAGSWQRLGLQLTHQPEIQGDRWQRHDFISPPLHDTSLMERPLRLTPLQAPVTGPQVDTMIVANVDAAALQRKTTQLLEGKCGAACISCERLKDDVAAAKSVSDGLMSSDSDSRSDSRASTGSGSNIHSAPRHEHEATHREVEGVFKLVEGVLGAVKVEEPLPEPLGAVPQVPSTSPPLTQPSTRCDSQQACDQPNLNGPTSQQGPSSVLLLGPPSTSPGNCKGIGHSKSHPSSGVHSDGEQAGARVSHHDEPAAACDGGGIVAIHAPVIPQPPVNPQPLVAVEEATATADNGSNLQLQQTVTAGWLAWAREALASADTPDGLRHSLWKVLHSPFLPAALDLLNEATGMELGEGLVTCRHFAATNSGDTDSEVGDGRTSTAHGSSPSDFRVVQGHPSENGSAQEALTRPQQEPSPDIQTTDTSLLVKQQYNQTGKGIRGGGAAAQVAAISTAARAVAEAGLSAAERGRAQQPRAGGKRRRQVPAGKQLHKHRTCDCKGDREGGENHHPDMTDALAASDRSSGGCSQDGGGGGGWGEGGGGAGGDSHGSQRVQPPRVLPEAATQLLKSWLFAHFLSP